MPNCVISIQLRTEVRAPGRFRFTTPVSTRSGSELHISLVKVTGLLPSLSPLGEGEARWRHGDDGLLSLLCQRTSRYRRGYMPSSTPPPKPRLSGREKDRISCQTAYLFIRLPYQTNLILLQYTLSRKHNAVNLTVVTFMVLSPL